LIETALRRSLAIRKQDRAPHAGAVFFELKKVHGNGKNAFAIVRGEIA
jgi:hypothetical protein